METIISFFLFVYITYRILCNRNLYVTTFSLEKFGLSPNLYGRSFIFLYLIFSKVNFLEHKKVSSINNVENVSNVDFFFFLTYT